MFHVPEYIRTLVPYVPGKPIEETKREFNLSHVVKLASNENPLGPSPKAMAAIQNGVLELSRYPDASGYQLKQALSQHLGVPFFCLTLGNGSNEVIDNLIRTFCLAGDQILTPKASFIAYKISAQIHGVETLEIEPNEDFQSDPAKIIAAVESNPKVKMVFISNPNNPTGSYFNRQQMDEVVTGLKAIRGGSVILVLDYAYWEYVTSPEIPEPLSLLHSYPGAVVLRTFSKIYGLAGLRVGYGIASAELISYLEKVRQPFNLNLLALLGAEAALSDLAFVTAAKEMNSKGMQVWKEGLERMGIPCRTTQGNFLLADVQKGAGLSGMEVFQACLARGVVFRPLANYGLRDYLRISIGTEKENAFALEALGAVCSKRTGLAGNKATA